MLVAQFRSQRILSTYRSLLPLRTSRSRCSILGGCVNIIDNNLFNQNFSLDGPWTVLLNRAKRYTYFNWSWKLDNNVLFTIYSL